MKKMFVMIVALLVSTIAFAQGTISGSVTDGSTGDPLPGASVLVKGTTNGVTADFDGNFTISANSGRCIGYFLFRVSNFRNCCKKRNVR